MISAAAILNPVKPVAPTVSSTAILSLEVLIDEQPVLKGRAEEALGTDLSGTLCLALKESLDATRIQVQLFGAAMEKLPGAGSQQNPEIVYTSSHTIWNASKTKSLVPGAHDIRFMFKLPGNLPATEAGRVQYVLRAVIEDGEKEVAALVEAVRIRRIIAGADGEEPLPTYEYDHAPAYSYDSPPPPAFQDHDLPPPPGYDPKGKARA
ncbi:hypothetical protein BCR33DRAFT_714035 [Rhizoclosmatium globosum]|uniref:Arrestin-like N-terminal domain-containing protein n=1 Tax=Rhizoclosmatium globosum TaxID=329046 RepID=A0A1Y2CPG8_9FUNG|nr:hypothetical protein BCR33DRAFT_714035 [Rhizoclosmatium globosum]|eukprot:ORY48928.1 hypothetical protein BCR33DRAFT_714035 [Rhizoclosmatium globosum]